MKTDAELLRDFVRRDADGAFAELVQRHIDVVYSAACRETQGDLSGAQDVTQLVFIELARKASRLQNHPTLAGWLYTTVRYVTANLRRGEHRRMMREEAAHTENELLQSAANHPLWNEVRPVLDDAMHELSEEDRDAVLLRYFEGRTFGEVGDVLGLTPNTARKRVERSLEKLRAALGRRGVHSTSSALGASLAVGMIAAPSSLVATVTSSALAAAAVSTASISGVLGSVTVTKSTAMIGLAAVLAVTVGACIWQQQRYERLARENDTALRKQLEQIAQLREEKQQMSGVLQAVQDRARDEHLELLRLRGRMAVARLELEKRKAPPPMDSWRQRFDAAYKLRENEVLKRVAPPFIPERTEYFRHVWSMLGRPWNSGRDYLIFCQNDQQLCERFRAYSIGINRARLGLMLSDVLSLKRYEFDGPAELLELVVPGDWVIRKDASRESLLAAFEAIVRQATGRNIRFEKQSGITDVIVVRGSSAPAKEQIVDLFAKNRNYFTGKDFQRGTFDKFLEYLGNRLNIRVASEVQILDPSSEYCWFPHPDSNGLRAGDRHVELIHEVIENLRRQTSLTFEFQGRPGEIWLVKDLDQSQAPPSSPAHSHFTKFGS